MRDILFVRTPIDTAPNVTVILRNLALAGWRVVSHHQGVKEYSFVLESESRPDSTWSMTWR
jgi:hypothetical protein